MDTKTQELVHKVIESHGGLENAGRFNSFKLHAKIGGAIWAMKGHPNALSDVEFVGSLTEQKGSWKHLFHEGYTSSFVPGKVALFDSEDQILEDLMEPRESFIGHTVETPWSRSQLVYFSSYATWNYATAPFNFLVPGVEINRIDDWNEQGETLQRLEVFYPEGFATHSKRQVFYFDLNGLLVRHDYWPEVLGGSSATQIIEDHKNFDGIITGTKRNIYVLNDADNTYQTDLVLVSIDILDVNFQ